MIHRDIKPTNIFLCRMGNEYDFAKVLDFGLVKVSEDRDETQMTVPGTTTGTPSYMAPELALGSPQIDGRTDLYGLGCVAYWLITGRLVFEETGSTAMMLAHLNKVPVPPSQKVASAVPASLDRAVIMCLAKSPADRPANAEALSALFDNLDDVGSWTLKDAASWWQSYMSEQPIYVDADASLVPTESGASPTL